MSDSNKTVQGLWVDGQLKTLQRLCIKSFIDNGYDFHLYTHNLRPVLLLKTQEQLFLKNEPYILI
jgi:hypothetical protein